MAADPDLVRRHELHINADAMPSGTTGRQLGMMSGCNERVEIILETAVLGQSRRVECQTQLL